ncbi:MAG: sugar kinase [Firmicutes bacterium]|nr:sugar kinase [Bacillota bacterium]
MGIMTVGEPLGVFTPTEPGRIGPDHLFHLRVAGAEVNVAIALARLKVPAWFGGAVGPDAVGWAVRRTLQAEGVNTTYLYQGEGPTGLMLKEWYGLQPEPRIYYFRRATAMHDWQPPEGAGEGDGIDGVHLTGITLMLTPSLAARVRSWVETWHARGRQLSLDINYRRRLGEAAEWRTRIEPILPYVNILFASREELEMLWGTPHPAHLEERGLIHPHQVVVITDGPRGAWAVQQGQEIARVEAFSVPRVVDVVGAGDGFVGGVLAGRVKGWDWVPSLRLGALVGAFAVAHPGDWEGYPTWHEAEALLTGQWVDR